MPVPEQHPRAGDALEARVLPAVQATRYVAPLREGGSLPGLVEADDLGIYVVKFTGAGQGVKALVAEVICAGIARALGIRTPDLVTIDLPPAIARYEADEEVQDLLNASPGVNLGVDFLPGAFGYDGSRPPPEREAADIVWLDAFTANVDRTWSNPNLLVWGGHTWAIDHGAALYFHHPWPRRAPDAARFAAQPYDATTHVLADPARLAHRSPDEWRDIHASAHDRLAPDVLFSLVAAVPDAWLEPAEGAPSAREVREAYVAHLRARLEQPLAWLPGGGRP